MHLLEAKSVLNRNVIGQVIVGADLLRRDFSLSEIRPVAVCAGGNSELAWSCERQGVEVAIYEVDRPGSSGDGSVAGRAGDGRLDIRKLPDSHKRSAFLGGWTDAVAGKLYGSVRTKKTHQNMGNLFGWIYGDQPEAFRVETWERYVSALGWDDADDEEEDEDE